MSGEYDQFARDMRDRLNAVSPSLCLAKWQQVSIHLPSGLTQSCYHPPTHKIPLELLKDNEKYHIIRLKFYSYRVPFIILGL